MHEKGLLQEPGVMAMLGGYSIVEDAEDMLGAWSRRGGSVVTVGLC